MRTRSAILATTLTVGLVAGVGTSALAVAFVPGDQSGSEQHVGAIASTSQDPAEGASSTFSNGEPAVLKVPTVVVDGRSGDRSATASPEVATEPPTTSQDSGKAEDKAAKEQAKKDKKAADEQAKKDKKAADEQAKKDKKAADEQAKKDKKAADEQAKKDKKAADEQAKKDKKAARETAT